jgi:hypothetical protein
MKFLAWLFFFVFYTALLIGLSILVFLWPIVLPVLIVLVVMGILAAITVGY